MHRYNPKPLNFSRSMHPLLEVFELGSPGLRFYIIIEYHRRQIIVLIFIEYIYIHMRVGISMEVSNRTSRICSSTYIGKA